MGPKWTRAKFVIEITKFVIEILHPYRPNESTTCAEVLWIPLQIGAKM